MSESNKFQQATAIQSNQKYTLSSNTDLQIESASAKLSQLINERHMKNSQQQEITLLIQGQNTKRKKVGGALSTTRGIKAELKQLNQYSTNAYQNYLNDLYFQTNRRNQLIGEQSQQNLTKMYSIKGNSRLFKELNQDLSSSRNPLDMTPLQIPNVSQEYQGQSLTMTPIVNRSQNNNITPEATTISGPLKQTFEHDANHRKIVGTTFDHRVAESSFENSMSRLPILQPASTSLDHYNQNFQDTMTQNNNQLDDSVLPFHNSSSQNASTLKRLNKKRINLMPLTNEHLKSVNRRDGSALKSQLPQLTERSISVGNNHQSSIRIHRTGAFGNKVLSSSRNSILLTGNAGYDDMLHHQAKTYNDSKANRQLLKSYKDTMAEVRQQSQKFNQFADILFEEQEIQNLEKPEENESQEELEQIPIGSLLTQKLYAQKLQIRKLKLISQKIDMKEIDIEKKLQEPVKKWAFEDQVQQSKEEITIYTDALVSLIGFLQNNCLPYDEEVASILSRAVKGIQNQQIQQEKGFALVISDYRKEVDKLKSEIVEFERQVQDLKSKLIEESKMFNDESKAYLEKRVQEFLNQGPQKYLVNPLVEGQELDRLCQLTQYEIRDQLVRAFEKLQYSGAQDDLNHIFTFLNFYQGFKKEILQENKRIIEKEDEMSNNPFILQSLKHDFGDTLKLTQTETARKVLQRYYKNVTTRDLHVQTMPEESYIRELENIISDKEDMIKATNQTLNKILQDNQVQQTRLAAEQQKCESLFQQLKQKSLQCDELEERLAATEKERQDLHDKNLELDAARSDMKRQVETLKEERVKTKMTTIMQKNQMVREIETLKEQIETARMNSSIEGSMAVRNSQQINMRSSHNTNISGVHRGETGIIDDDNDQNSQTRSSRVEEDERPYINHSQQDSQVSVQIVSKNKQINSNEAQAKMKAQEHKNKEKQPIQIKDQEQSNSPDNEISRGGMSPDQQKMKPQYNNKKVEGAAAKKTNEGNRVQIALENAKNAVDVKTLIANKSQSREHSDENPRTIYGNASTLNGTPQMTKFNAKINIDLQQHQQSPIKKIQTQPKIATITEDQGTQNSINRSQSEAEMITIQLSDTAGSHPMLHIYAKPIVTLKKYKNDLLLTNHLIKEFISKQRGSISLDYQETGIDVGIQTEQFSTKAGRKIQKNNSKSPRSDLKKIVATFTVSTQTRLVGEVKTVQNIIDSNIQCEAWDIDREVEREMLQIENIEKLYGGKQNLLKTYLSRQNQQYSPTIRRAVGGGVKEGGSQEQSQVLGGSLDRQKYMFFDNKEHFKSQKLPL